MERQTREPVLLRSMVWITCLMAVGIIPLGLAKAWPSAPARVTEAPTFPTDLLAVGKVFEFGVESQKAHGKLLEEPRGSWARVEVWDDNQDERKTIWLNLNHLAWIDPDPPPPKREVGP